jgi:hypothetical protein
MSNFRLYGKAFLRKETSTTAHFRKKQGQTMPYDEVSKALGSASNPTLKPYRGRNANLSQIFLMTPTSIWSCLLLAVTPPKVMAQPITLIS